MILVCHSLLNSQNISINNSEKRLATGTLSTFIKAAEVAQEKEQ